MSFLVTFICWRLPIKILKSGISLFNLGAGEQRSGRRRPLYTCGASLLAIAQKTCTKLQDLDGPLGSTANRAASFMNQFLPFIHTLLCPFLTILSYLDDHILRLETKVETIFPLSACLFDKIDTLVCRSEALPEQIDGVLAKILTRKKEITVDVNSKPNMKSCPSNEMANCEVTWKSVDGIKIVEDRYFASDSPMCSSYLSANSSPVSDCSESEITHLGQTGKADRSMSYSYKEMLERGQKEVHEKGGPKG
ncbi:tRNA 5-methylaminomethyl-2-thiouridinebiosynthesis bifunctional protein MnmC [Striga asiatica]|uniref:tRNA 5-methylaminomethyl-2-thiouridinebiosynthesis bifunctional protein MnmC n=1 Tax=Striga asiatica TaxID=4170 RepID=A0A5A7RGR9_STRAF|nr:tRNA 5-methylaminomethyl-2-thiouridinebiosynthesis bifunctional protein MnmC [Striga asiatica]